MLIPFEETGGADDDDVELDALETVVLRDIARCEDSSWRTDRLFHNRAPAGDLLAALTRLELERLVESRFGGAALTRKGRRVAARLDSTS